MSYDALNRLTEMVDAVGTSSYTCDYWPNGQMKSVTDPLTNITYYEYTDAGQQSFVVDANNSTNRFDYDAVGRQIATIFPNSYGITNIFNNVGQRTGQVDQAGLTNLFAYNLSGQLTNVTKPKVPDPENWLLVHERPMEL